MKAMTSFTLKSLKDSKARTVVTIAGVALAAALLVAVLSSYVSATEYMLRNEVAQNGTWMSQVIVPDDEASREELAAARQADDVKSSATLQDLGFVELSSEQRTKLGTYLPVLVGAGSIEEVCGVRVGEGRLAQGPDEIVLPYTWQRNGGVSIGDTVTLDIGRRQAVLAPGKTGEMSTSVPKDASDLESQADSMVTVQDGTQLNSTMGILDSASDQGIFDEEVVDAQRRTFIVVGFTAIDNWSLMTGAGPAALTADSSASGDIQVFLDIDGVSTSSQLVDRTEELFPGADVSTHVNLLRYSGISDHGNIWQTLFYLVAILAAIIMTACVSLIYNAFAISVNERMRQFGLLASVGASKRQLRHSVFLEGAVIAGIGIPLGIVVGLGACAGIFAWLGSAIGDLLGGRWSPFYLVVSWQVILFAVILTAVTVLISVWIPALRASRVSPMNALRQSAVVKVSSRALRATREPGAKNGVWKHGGLSGAVFGIGGRIASLNHKRNASKGRAASISLALAIILLMTAGSLSTQLGMFTKVAGNLSDADISMGIAFEPEEEGAGAPATIEAVCADAYDRASAVNGVTPLGWSLVSTQPGLIPSDVAGSALSGSVTQGSLVDGDVPSMMSVIYLPQDQFAAYAKDNGIELPESSGAPIAIGVREGYGNTGQVYTYDELFARTGTISIVSGVRGEDAPLSLVTTDTTEDGRESLEFVLLEGDGSADRELAASDLVRTPVDVVGLADQRPACAGSSNGAAIVVPLSEADALPFQAATRNILFSAAFDAVDAGEAVEPLTQVAPVIESAGYTIYYNQVTDNDAAEESMAMMVTVVNLFCFLFSLILTLIALANVFNTVTNGLILRRREFAVMESIGMGGRQFRSMIGCECIGYGLRGLIPGIIVSFVVSYLLYMALSVSMQGFPFSPPWASLAFGCLLVIVVMAASVIYGLRRCRKGNVVEALRME